MASANVKGLGVADDIMRDEFVAVPDLVIHILCNTIAEDNIMIARRLIFPHLDNIDKIKLRELRVLNVIFNWRGEINASQIAETLRCDPATVTRAVATLENVNMVERRDDKFDHRSINIKLTSKGEALAQQYIRRFDVVIGELKKHQNIEIPQEEYDQFVKTLYKVSQRVANMRRLKIGIPDDAGK